ncbi:AAA family ATPase [Mucilaginibacter myungsuensis]|uniref:AAA family ATPase n=1 Tax=Mucilaginibacter myungsuensis TaxID=649104 RepID=A0A929PY41_9SPHI|nr:AAA family ATPase [Mucilaginibacter myungsuensis]MBE9663784.1 AAA family ATPase [Mucilaginibacter myungsuensis]MDN3598501.1 AAA family ATPase [Mucilaginibacter myungsuensis]
MMEYLNQHQRPEVIERIRGSYKAPKTAEEKAQRAATEAHWQPPADALLDIKSANQWIDYESQKPPARRLFGDFWLEGELCILFADTNIGKSVLAVQLGDSISRQKHINGFELERPPSPVLYVDFELSAKQFQQRYTDNRGSYKFHENFYRAEVNLEAPVMPGFADQAEFMAYKLHRGIKYTGAEVLIIDNITCMGPGAESAGKALNMMKQLKMLKTRHGLSILVLAHTPKRKAGLPITRNDLGGSKLLMNFADSAMAMAESCTQPGHRYLKQVKQRSAAETYGANKVCLFNLERDGPFLQFTTVDTLPEHTQLINPEIKERNRLLQAVISYQSQGFTQRQMADALNISLGMVNKLVKEAGE